MGLFLAAKCRPLPTNSPTIFKPCKKTKEGACVKKQKVSWLDLFWKAFKHLTWSSVDFREYDVRIRVNASAKNCGNYILMFLPVKKKTKKALEFWERKLWTINILISSKYIYYLIENTKWILGLASCARSINLQVPFELIVTENWIKIDLKT